MQSYLFVFNLANFGILFGTFGVLWGYFWGLDQVQKLLETPVETAGDQCELLTVIVPSVHASMMVRVESRCDQDLWEKIPGTPRQTHSQSKENLPELFGTG